MLDLLNHPLLILVFSLLAFWISTWIGALLRARKWDVNVQKGAQEDFTLILGATLTLLGLIVGFTFSMAVSRYDQRKYFEEQEANAIGTEYVRANLLPTANAARVRALLRRYLDQRILYYDTRNEQQLPQINTQTAQLQTEMWSAVETQAAAQPTPVAALVVAGMNDVLNSQGYAQFAWWNRVPRAAWVLLVTIAIFCNLLVGYVARVRSAFLFLILPIALSISFFLIADIDSPRAGLIHVHPQNLGSLSESLRSH
jgi:hypothetical protein